MMLLRAFVHYGLHFLAPWFIAALWRDRPRWKVYLLLLATMAVDLDHLLARPIFDPTRCSVGYHLLHSYPMIVIYVLMAVLPWGRWGAPWWIRVLGVGLVFHMITDFQDFYLWRCLL